jgi:hypothetical protein
MAEIRRKLVIVGDGACGKTCLLMYVLVHAALADMCPLHCVLQRLTETSTVSSPRAPSPRSVPPRFSPPSLSCVSLVGLRRSPSQQHHACTLHHAHTDFRLHRSTSPLSSRTTSPMSRSTASTSSSPSGIPLARKITTASVRFHTPTRTSS